MSPISTRICVPNLVAVQQSCRKKGGYRQTDKGKLQLYIVDMFTIIIIILSLFFKTPKNVYFEATDGQLNRSSKDIFDPRYARFARRSDFDDVKFSDVGAKLLPSMF